MATTLNTRSSDRARITRAATETMKVVSTDKAGQFIVYTAHGGAYTVDAQAKTCTCADFRNRIAKMRRRGDRNAACKHLLRVTNGKRLLQAQLLIGEKKRQEWGEAV